MDFGVYKMLAVESIVLCTGIVVMCQKFIFRPLKPTSKCICLRVSQSRTFSHGSPQPHTFLSSPQVLFSLGEGVLSRSPTWLP